MTAVHQRCSLKDDMFPIIIGRRPNSGLNDSGKFSTTSIGTGSDDHNSSNGTDRPPTVTSFKHLRCVMRKAVFGVADQV